MPIHDDQGNSITIFPKVDSKRVMPTKVQKSVLPDDAATSAKQLVDGHNVTVSNPTADPETDLAKDDTLTDGTQQSKVKETAPTDTTKTNPSLALSNTDETVDSTKTLTMTIGATKYTSILSYNAGGDFLSMSVWSEA